MLTSVTVAPPAPVFKGITLSGTNVIISATNNNTTGGGSYGRSSSPTTSRRRCQPGR